MVDKGKKKFLSIFLAVATFLVLGIVLVQSVFRKEVSTISPNQIKIQKGEKVVIVNDNGLIEYRTPDRVFYETWDSQKVSDFFNLMEQKAREYLANPQPAEGDGYYLTLYLDGKEVTVFIVEDQILDKVFEKFIPPKPGGFISEFFDDFLTEEKITTGGSGGITPTPTGPTPTPLIVSAQEGTPAPGSGTGGPQPVVECGLFQENVTNRTIISNTLCIVETSEP